MQIASLERELELWRNGDLHFSSLLVLLSHIKLINRCEGRGNTFLLNLLIVINFGMDGTPSAVRQWTAHLPTSSPARDCIRNSNYHGRYQILQRRSILTITSR